MSQDTGFRKRADCTPEASLRYVGMYFATVDLVSEALGKFQILASDATTVSQRSLYRAKALEAERDLELLKIQRRAFCRRKVRSGRRVRRWWRRVRAGRRLWPKLLPRRSRRL